MRVPSCAPMEPREPGGSWGRGGTSAFVVRVPCRQSFAVGPGGPPRGPPRPARVHEILCAKIATKAPRIAQAGRESAKPAEERREASAALEACPAPAQAPSLRTQGGLCRPVDRHDHDEAGGSSPRLHIDPGKEYDTTHTTTTVPEAARCRHHGPTRRATRRGLGQGWPASYPLNEGRGAVREKKKVTDPPGPVRWEKAP